MKRKNQIQPEAGQTIKIAVAGAGPRMGITHLAFRLCKYITGQGFQCLYEEKNLSGCIRSMKNCYEEVDVKDGIYRMEGIAMCPFDRRDTPDLGRYQAVVQDLGRLTGENLQEFLHSDIKLLILGAKDWELELSQKVIPMTAEYKDITYLFNFMNGRQFQQIMKSMDHKESYRIPYEPDPFAKITPDNGLEFFREMIRPIRRVTIKERAAAVLRRGIGRNEAKTDTV
jgi:serine/threonine-protein kinase